MKLSSRITSLFLVAFMILASMPASAADDDMLMYQNSDFIEKEKPELSEETKRLISIYQNNPTEENYLNLQNAVTQNYNAVLERKEAKLEELKAETAGKVGGEEKVAEMEEIVRDMYDTYWNSINSTMLRFTDSRILKWRMSDASKYEYVPVMGAGESIYIKRTPVTNAEYMEYVSETGAYAPPNWTEGAYPAGEDNFPVNYVSYDDAEAYCEWLTEKDGENTYRLPSESEWELAAGHMPKDADFNCGVNDGRTDVEQYADSTKGANGAVDFWGNVWEWTSTMRLASDGATLLGIKGGSWSSARTDCRTEYRKESRNATERYEDVGFRVVQVLDGNEPEQKLDITALDTPIITAKEQSIADDIIFLVEYTAEGALITNTSNNAGNAMIVTAYYDTNGTLTEVSVSSKSDFLSGEVYSLPVDTNKVKYRVFVLNRGSDIQ